MKTLTSAIALFVAAAACSTAFGDGTSYQASFSASFPNQMQSCSAAQAQAERLVHERFRAQLGSGAYDLSIDDKHCECAKNIRFQTPLYDCMGYATGTLQARAGLQDDACISRLTANASPDTWTLRMSGYLSCVRRQPGYNRTWDDQAMQRVRDQQSSESAN